MRTNQRVLMWVIVGLLSIGFFCLSLFTQGRYTVIQGYLDACTLAGVATLLLYLLYAVYRLGAFDMVVYGFKDIFYHLNPAHDKVAKYDDYGDYREKKKEARRRHKSYWYPFIFIGGAFLIASIVLRIVMAVTLGY